MNVIHALAGYLPESTGGTEVYVAGLVNELRAFGISSTIAAAYDGGRSVDCVQDGVVVHRYPFAQTADLAAVRAEQPYQNFSAFVAWLKEQPRTVYHQHSWTTSCGRHHIHAAKSLGFKTVLTVHVPGNICLRGTLMEYGCDPCDGRVQAKRCASCWAQARGLWRPAAQALSHVPQIISRTAYRSGAENRFVTAIAARELASERQREIKAIVNVADRIVVVCSWLAEVLRRNHICDEKVVLCRQGVGCDFISGKIDQIGDKKDVFRLGFLGRCDPVKGLPVLLRAIEKLPPDLGFELIIYAVANSELERRHRDALKANTTHDPRIKFMPPVTHANVPAVLAGFDMLVVPSQWIETGPLVVLEALAVGVPVLGSNLGGIAELVAPGIDGHLVEFSDLTAWADTISNAAAGNLPCQGKTKTWTPRSVRTMANVAQDMAALYASIG